MTSMVYGPFEIETKGTGTDRFYYIVDGRDGRIVGRSFHYLRNARKQAARLSRRPEYATQPSAPLPAGVSLPEYLRLQGVTS